MHMPRAIIGILLGAVLLSSCMQKEDVPVLPEGQQSVTGILERAELSISRRGTHVLLQSSEPVLYIESPTVDLTSLVGRSVTLLGEYTYNIDPTDLPVFLVEEAMVEEIPSTVRSIPSLQMSFAAPDSWEQTVESAEVVFHLPGQEHPLLFISETEAAPLPQGLPLFIDGLRAVRVEGSEPGAQTVYVQRPQSQMILNFTPQHVPEEVRQRTLGEFSHLLSTIRFAGGASSSAMSNASTGARIVCGGTAGLLCPAGHYCSIQDFELNAGVCLPIR